MFTPLKTLGRAAAAVALVSLSSCTSPESSGGSGVPSELPSGLPAGLTEALGSVTELAGSITEFSNSLGASLDEAGLSQLSGYVSQAGDLGEMLGGFQAQLSEAAADPMGAITSKLGELGSFDLSALEGMADSEQIEAVKGFAQTATGVGTSVTELLAQFSA